MIHAMHMGTCPLVLAAELADGEAEGKVDGNADAEGNLGYQPHPVSPYPFVFGMPPMLVCMLSDLSDCVVEATVVSQIKEIRCPTSATHLCHPRCQTPGRKQRLDPDPWCSQS
jgi:hypothetical protein